MLFLWGAASEHVISSLGFLPQSFPTTKLRIFFQTADFFLKKIEKYFLSLFLSAFFFVDLFHVLSSLLCSSLAISLFLLRNIPVISSLSVGFASEGKAKFYRSSIEDLSNIYRRPIEHLSKTYRTSIEDLSKKGWRGSRESRGRFWLQSYKIPNLHFHLFGR